MSVSHHGDEDRDNIKWFMAPMDGTAKRAYPAGRMGHEDDGSLSYAIAADRTHNTVIIRFGKPVEWIGLRPEDVNNLRDMLLEKLMELQAGPAPTKGV